MSAAADRAATRVLFWDIGGVLLTNGWDVDQRRGVLMRLGADVAAYEALHDEVNFFWERGLITAREFFERTLFRTSPDLGIGFDELWAMVCAESRVLYVESFDVLKSLRASGRYRMATLNNESRELNAHRLDAFGLRTCFELFICSGYVHEMKPAPRIYEDAIAISGFPAAAAVFIDDKAENCEAARAQGMQAIHFQAPVQLRNELTQLGIQTA